MRTPQHSPEKLCFVGAAVIFAGALYYCLASTPLTLRPAAPQSRSTALPLLVASAPLPERGAEEAYVYGGVDPQTGQRINRERMYPFEPVVAPVVAQAPEIPVLRPPEIKAAAEEKLKPPAREFAPIALASAVEYTGVLSANGLSYGVLKRTDGSGYLQVKEGAEFTLAGELYRVERLEKQAICVSCDGVCVILKNRRWAGELPPQKRERGESRIF